jgi:hypothetical protein
MGEIGLTQKGTYDREVWRVPFILSWPGHIAAGEQRRDLIELMDFGPTLLALAGLAPAAGMHGRDLFNSAEPQAVHGAIDILKTRRVGVRTRRYRFDCTVRSRASRWGSSSAIPTCSTSKPTRSKRITWRATRPMPRRSAGCTRALRWLADRAASRSRAPGMASREGDRAPLMQPRILPGVAGAGIKGG